MTLNELIERAKKDKIDFDLPVFVDNSNTMEQYGMKGAKKFRVVSLKSQKRTTRDAFDGYTYEYNCITSSIDENDEGRFAGLYLSEY